MNLLHLPNGYVYDADTGRTIYVPAEEFRKNIVEGHHCFICNASPDAVPFNAEHVIPDWILRRYNLHSQRITLPNNATLLYGQYTVPCCEACNSLMADEFETPISKLLAQGYNAVVEFLEAEGPDLLFTWITRIFLKTHLKDRELRFHLDRREPDVRIADLHTWGDFHHLHCVSRAFYTGATLAPEVIGSLIVLPMDKKITNRFSPFDYGDLSEAQAVLLQLDDICFICVLNDCKAAQMILREDELKRITHPITPLQAEEVLANAAFINTRLRNRPRFVSSIGKNDYAIVAQFEGQGPELEPASQQETQSLLGSLMYRSMFLTLESIGAPPEIHKAVLQGRYSVLFDDKGQFINNSMIFEQDMQTPPA